jgi:hypothetical protein
MEKLFLLSSVNGNGESFLLVLFDEQAGSCQKHFKSNTVEKMAKHLSEEHLGSVEEQSIETTQIPCSMCSKKKKCTQKAHLELLLPKVVKEIYQLAENSQRDGIEHFMNEGE